MRITIIVSQNKKIATELKKATKILSCQLLINKTIHAH